MSCLKWAISQDFLGAFLLRPDAPFLPTAVSGFKKTFLYHLCQDAPTHSWHYFDILNLVYFYYDFIIFCSSKIAINTNVSIISQI